MPALEAHRRVEQPCTKGLRGAMLGLCVKTAGWGGAKERTRRGLLRADVLWCRQGSSKKGGNFLEEKRSKMLQWEFGL